MSHHNPNKLPEGVTPKYLPDGKENPKYVDLLEEDKPIAGQKFVCLSFVSPEHIIKQKEHFLFEEFIKQWDFKKSMEKFTQFLNFVSFKYSVSFDKLTADFQDFKLFLKATKFSFDTQTQLALKATLTAAKKEKIEETIKAEYDKLLAALQKSENSLLDKNQKEIKNLIQEELIKRYQYQEGLYQFYLKNNFEIKRASQVLSSATEYKTILKM
jgi:hypothetical protein